MANQTLNVGDAAPDFELMNQDKSPVKLSSFRDKKKVVLLFYPMDFSPCSARMSIARSGHNSARSSAGRMPSFSA